MLQHLRYAMYGAVVTAALIVASSTADARAKDVKAASTTADAKPTPMGGALAKLGERIDDERPGAASTDDDAR